MIAPSREKSRRLDGKAARVLFYKKKNGGERMSLETLLEVRPGVTAVIGGGGKTTLLRTLGEELARQGRVLLCTTTKMLPDPDVPFAGDRQTLMRLREGNPLLFAGTVHPESGKIMAPEMEMAELAEWFDYVLVEADGAARLPLKAHAPHEPVIPPEANQTICVVGASGFGRPIREAAHRPELYAERGDVTPDAVVTGAIAAAVLEREALHDRIYVNQVDVLPGTEEVLRLDGLVRGPVVAGSLWKGEYFLC